MHQISLSIVLAPVSFIMEPEDSLIMGNEELSTIPEKESDEFIKSSVEDLIPIPRESEDTSGSDGESVLPSSDDFSPIFKEKSVTFSNPLFDSNDFTSSDDELLSEEDIPKETFNIYSNPLFDFDDDFTSSDVNPLFNEVLENVESEDSFDSKLAEPTLLILPLSDANKDECFDPGGDEIDAFLDLDISTETENDFHDSEGDIIFLEKLLINNTFPNLPFEVFLDHDPRSLKDEANVVELLNLEERNFLSISSDRELLFFLELTMIETLLSFSFENEDKVFNPEILTSKGVHSFTLELSHQTYKTFKIINVHLNILNEGPMKIFPFFSFHPKDKEIRGESS
ncbi:hypothetical protein Tco_0761490 [Tanacetum coccineum]